RSSRPLRGFLRRLRLQLHFLIPCIRHPRRDGGLKHMGTDFAGAFALNLDSSHLDEKLFTTGEAILSFDLMNLECGDVLSVLRPEWDVSVADSGCHQVAVTSTLDREVIAT